MRVLYRDSKLSVGASRIQSRRTKHGRELSPEWRPSTEQNKATLELYLQARRERLAKARELVLT